MIGKRKTILQVASPVLSPENRPKMKANKYKKNRPKMIKRLGNDPAILASYIGATSLTIIGVTELTIPAHAPCKNRTIKKTR